MNDSQNLSVSLEKLESLLIDYLKTPNEPTNQVLQHVFAAKGKRLRPTLFLLTSALFDYAGIHKFPIAAVCEYIHTASLLHDDVIDNSQLRRNRPTTNSLWGDQTAILVGDLIYSAACRLMVKTENLELIDTFAECIRFMSESELFQLQLLWKTETTYEEYLRLISGKTASLFEASCKTAALLANQSQEIVALSKDYGYNLGMAFQITDDCLDYSNNNDTLGKPIATDLINGKVTLPILLGMLDEHFGQNLKVAVHSILQKGNTAEFSNTDLIDLLKRSRGLEKSAEIAKGFATQAITALEKISQKTNIGDFSYSRLKEIADSVTHRLY